MNAGDDEIVTRGNHTLNGSKSYKFLGLITNYTWTFTDIGTQTLYDETPTYNFTHKGDFIIMLNITDGLGNYSYDNVTITVINTILAITVTTRERMLVSFLS